MKQFNKKCHNCKNGSVDGGAQKRIQKEIKYLEQEKSNKIHDIKNTKAKGNQEEHQKNQNKLIKKVELDYSKKLEQKANEDFIEHKCSYCRGTGFKK